MNNPKIEELAEKLYKSIRYTPYTMTKEQLDAIDEYENFQGKGSKMKGPQTEEFVEILRKLRRQFDDYRSIEILETTMVEVDAILDRCADVDVGKVEDPVKVAIEETSQEWAKALTSLIDFLGGDGPSLWNWCGETPTPDKIVAYLKEHVKYLEELAADSELYACCEYLDVNGEYVYRDGLRRLRRPQPTLKSQALKDLETVRKNSDVLPEILDTIEEVLKSAPEVH